jgi:hypothetical protein
MPIELDGGGVSQGVFNAPFVVEITGVTGSAPYVYSWKEKILDPTGTDYLDAEGGRTGDGTNQPLYEINDTSVATGTLVMARVRGIQDGDLVYEFAAPSAGTLTVKESDGSPSYTDILSLEFDQAAGFVVTQPGTGQAKVSQAGLTVKETDSSPTYTGISTLEFNEDRGAIVTQPATGRAEISWQDAYGTPSLAPGAASGPGLISADGNDQYLGDGYKYADAWCGAHITIDTVMKTAGYILAAGSVSGSINGAGAFCTVTAGNTYTGSPSMVGGGDVHAIWGLVSRDYYPGNDTSLFYIDAGDPALVRNIVYGIVLPDRTLKEGASGSLAKCEIHGGIVCGGSATIDINDDTTGTLDIANGGTGLSSAPADGTVLTSDGSIYNATPAHVLVAKWTLTV